jgi:hypothetical protein
MKGLFVLGTFAVLAVSSASIEAENGRADARATPRVLAPIQVAVFAPPDVRQSLVTRVFAEVEAIWGPTGIVFDWHRMTATDAVHTEHLDVTIDERDDGFVAHPDALGWIPFTADVPGSCIHLSRRRAEALIRGTSDLGDHTILTHEMLLGRALGRALSHELGHYLLQSKAHTQRGLMRAAWPSQQVLSFNRGGFELSAEQREAATRRVQQVARTKSAGLERGSNDD